MGGSIPCCGRKMNEDKGRLKYSSPKNRLIQRGFGFFVIGFCWFAVVAVVYAIVTGEVNGRIGSSPALFWIMAPIAILGMIFMPFLGATVFLHPTFRIYEHGLTTPRHSIIKPSKEGKFVPFSKMKAYKRWGKRPHQISVYLSETEHIGYSHLWGEVMDMLEEELMSRGIPEMPSHCPTCRERLYTYMRMCPKCGSPVFGED